MKIIHNESKPIVTFGSCRIRGIINKINNINVELRPLNFELDNRVLHTYTVKETIDALKLWKYTKDIKLLICEISSLKYYIAAKYEREIASISKPIDETKETIKSLYDQLTEIHNLINNNKIILMGTYLNNNFKNNNDRLLINTVLDKWCEEHNQTFINIIPFVNELGENKCFKGESRYHFSKELQQVVSNYVSKFIDKKESEVVLDYPLVVPCCSNYIPILKIFSYAFNKYWGNQQKVDIITYKNSKLIELPDNFIYHKVSWDDHGSQFFNHLLADYLETINNKYVFYMLPDYLMAEFPHSDINSLFNIMDKFDGKHMPLNKHVNKGSFAKVKHGNPLSTLNDLEIYRKNDNSQHAISLVPSIWERKTFERYLRLVSDPWRFELVEGEHLAKKEKLNVLLLNKDVIIISSVLKSNIKNFYVKKLSEEYINDLKEKNLLDDYELIYDNKKTKNSTFIKDSTNKMFNFFDSVFQDINNNTILFAKDLISVDDAKYLQMNYKTYNIEASINNITGEIKFKRI